MDDDQAAVDDYIAAFPPDVQVKLRAVRAAIHEVIPEATEGISYGIPTFYVDGHYLVYLAGWKRHVSVYPVPTGDDVLEADLAPYRTGKGTLQFPLGSPIPDGLIRRIVRALRDQRGSS
jgi:uncharacterized protein YdhG (YjbR/CyaY superfamily)